MRCFIVLLSLALALTVNADDLSCPNHATGKHPNCICAGKQPYDEINRICATELNVEALLAKCPKGSEGTFPACICGEGKVYVPAKDECVVIDKSKCPAGAKKVGNKCVCETINEFKYEFDEIFWICRPWYIPTTPKPTEKPCPPHQHYYGDKCVWDKCPSGYESKTGFWPDCYAPRTCAQEGKRGDYPNCRAIEVVRTCLPHQTGVYPQCTWLPCPEAFLSKSGYWPDCLAPPSCNDFGQLGKYPDCYDKPPPCPPHQHRNADGECVRVRCPPGFVGEWQPDCVSVPKCPAEYPGVWPYCNIYATTPASAKTTEGSTTTTTQKTTTPTKTTTTTEGSTTTTTRKTTTPTQAKKCHCDCYSDEIVIFRDNVVRDPSRKYKRYINLKHSNKN